MNNEFSKPKVTIDLEEYEWLKKRSVREDLIPLLGVGQRMIFRFPGEDTKGRVNAINLSRPNSPTYGITTPSGDIEITILYNE